MDGKLDLIMMDLVMPGMNGHQTASALSRRFPGVQFLYTSGYTGDSATRRKLSRESIVFLEKPYTVADLAHAVQRALIGRGRTSVAAD
jgi:DNA-binding NarL/FixJ family response regulator